MLLVIIRSAVFAIHIRSDIISAVLLPYYWFRTYGKRLRPRRQRPQVEEVSTAPGRRAGRYVAQPQGYRAFMPGPLPPQPPVRLEGELQALLSQTDQALGRLDRLDSDAARPGPAGVHVRAQGGLCSPARSRARRAPCRTCCAAEARIRSPDRPRDVDEVIKLRNRHELRPGSLETLPISSRLIQEIHAQLLQGVRGSQMQLGELRTSQNWIGPAGCTLNEATFVPPPHREVPNALGALEGFVHGPHQATGADSSWAGPRPVRDNPSVPGWERTRRPAAHHVSAVSTGHPETTGALSFALLQAAPQRLLRPAAGGAGPRADWEGWLAFFLRGVAEVQRPSRGHRASHTLLCERNIGR